MAGRTVDGPADDWLTEEQAVQYLKLNGSVFKQLVRAGHVPGVRRLSKQCVLYHWKGLLVLQWRLELGDVPTLADPDAEANPAKAGESGG